MASLKDALAPTLLVAGAVFATFATPLVFVGERQVTIRMDRDVVYDGIIRDVSLPYIAFSLVVSMGAGLTTMTVAGWSSSTKRNVSLESEREALRAELHEKEIQIDELKLSSANLAAAGLDSFLDAAESMPQASEVMAEMLADDPFITVEPVASAPAAAPRTMPQPIQLSPEVVAPAQPRAPQTVAAEAVVESAPASTHSGATISGEVLHVYGALQDRFEHAETASNERSTAASRAYAPAPVEATPPSTLAPEVVGFYSALYDRFQTIDIPSPEQRGVAPSRAYTPDTTPLTTNPTHLEAQAPNTYQATQIQQAQPTPVNVDQAPTSHPPISQPTLQPPAVAPAQPATPPQPLVAEASPIKVVSPAAKIQPTTQPSATQTKLATDANSQAAAAYAVLGLSESPQTTTSTPAETSDVDLEQLTALLEADLVDSVPSTVTPAPATPAPISMPWDQWLEESALETTESVTPAALAGLEAWLTPTETADEADGSVLSDWDRWLQQQQAPPKQPQSRNNLDDWLAAFDTSDSTEAEPSFFEMPLAAPDTRMPKVVRFQRGAAHSRKDS